MISITNEIKRWLSDLTLDAKKRRAKQAAIWLEDDTLNGALALMRQRAIRQFSKSADEASRTEAYYDLRAADRFALALKVLVATDKKSDR